MGDLDSELPKTRGGVLSLDLLLAARRRGFEASLETGDAAVLRREIDKGRPAILMLRPLDAPGRRRDIYHYVVVDGFEPERQLFRFQFGDGRARWSRLGDVEPSWKASGHALLSVRPASSSLAAGLRRGVELEKRGRSVEAADLYRELLKAYPDSARTWVNLGNAQAAAGRRSEAQAACRAALRIAPGDQDPLNNLAWLLLQDGDRLDEAETLAMRAVAEPQLEGAQSLETLGRIQLARNRCRDAVATFEGALSLAEAPSAGLRAFLLEGLGQAYRTCGDAEAARAAFRAALLADPGSSAAENARSALQALENRP